MRTLPSIDIVIPVLNEEVQLAECVLCLLSFLNKIQKYTYRILIADNGSEDRTPVIGQSLAHRFDSVFYFRIHQRGRGRALAQCWMDSHVDMVAYMDVDLSTDLHDFPKLMAPLIQGHADLSVGTRLSSASRTRRSLKRDFLSRCYNRLIQTMFRVTFTDAQCGFKAMTTSAAKALLPFIESKHWFWDTELLLLASHLGYRIANVPVTWTEDQDSRVKLLETISEDIKGLIRMRRTLSGSVNQCHPPLSRLANPSGMPFVPNQMASQRKEDG